MFDLTKTVAHNRLMRWVLSVLCLLVIVGVIIGIIKWRSVIGGLKTWVAFGAALGFIVITVARTEIVGGWNRFKARITRSTPYIAVVVSKESVDFPIPTEF